MNIFLKTVILVFLFLPTLVFGCSLAPEADRFKDPTVNVLNYNHAFIATVNDVAEISPYEGRTYSMDVSYDFKNSVIDTIKVNTPGHSCGTSLSVGDELLIITDDPTSIDESTPFYRIATSEQKDNYISNMQRTLKGSQNPPRVCTKEYAPVCAEMPVLCVQAPCVQPQKTFSNQCVAESEGFTKIVRLGECRPATPVVTEEPEVGTPTIPQQITDFTEPETGPPTDFRSPTSPPPSKDPAPTVERPMTFWEKAGLFFRGLLFWR